MPVLQGLQPDLQPDLHALSVSVSVSLCHPYVPHPESHCQPFPGLFAVSYSRHLHCLTLANITRSQGWQLLVYDGVAQLGGGWGGCVGGGGGGR